MVEDWSAVIAAVRGLPDVSANAIGYVGLSMGAAYGIPLCAAGDLTFAVVGNWDECYPNSAALGTNAGQMTLPTLFIQKWDDAVMSRDGQLSLFGKIASARKQLNVYPGAHSDLTVDIVEDICTFASRQLKRRGP